MVKIKKPNNPARMACKNCHTSLWALILWACCFVTQSWADDESESARIKTAYLYNLLKFIQQPGLNHGNEHEVYFCMIGEENMVTQTAKKELTNRLIQKKQIIIKQIPLKAEKPYPYALEGCQIAYFNLPPDKVLPLLPHANEAHMITVSDWEGFAEQGGMVELGINQAKNRISIIINKKTCKDATVNVSAKLLQLAKVIE